MNTRKLIEIFEEVETVVEYSGYYYDVSDAITIAVLGSVCGLKNVSQIHQWAESERTREFLKEKFGIERIPCYYWLLSLLKMVKPDSLNRCLSRWATTLMPEERAGLTIAVDGKTVRSTEKMKNYQQPLHIISAQLSELGLTMASKSVPGKSNEIPAVQDLLEELDICGCLVVADALNCQKETAKAVIKGNGDYLLCVKANQQTLLDNIRDYIQDDQLRETMDTHRKREKSRGRIETRTAYVTTDVDWLAQKRDWAELACIGAVQTQFQTGENKTYEWHYYISSRPLTALEILHHARMEWSVETMHWLLDVHFGEDYLRVVNRNIQENINLLRKFVLSMLKQFKENTSSKRPISKIMFDCLLNPHTIIRVLSQN